MTYNSKHLAPYIKTKMELIPLYPWNKMKSGKERGKTPINNEWTIRPYKNSEVKGWIKKGLNLGIRIKENQLVVDLDPRNYIKGTDSPQLVAELFGYFEFEDMLWELPVVKTGSGGYHIYFNLPKEISYKQIKSKLSSIPGVDFKKKGGYVVAAGSRHPNGEYYTWENIEAPVTLTEEQLKPLLRKVVEKDYTSGYGALNGSQLQELILDKLEITDYGDNDRWFPIMCAAHHATAGDGIEEFLEWSLSDIEYANDENAIRTRWESLHSDKEYMSTVGTLIYELEQLGEETNNIKAVLTFSQNDLLETDDDDSEESEMLTQSKKIAEQIDYSDIYKDHDFTEEAGVEGKAIESVNNLPNDPGSEEVAKCLRLIKSADMYEAAKALEMLSKATKISKSTLSKMLKEMEAQIADDLALIISNKTLEIIFNKGKHLTCSPSGILYGFKATHWIKISDEFMSKLVQSTLHNLKERMEIKGQELSLITQAVKLSRIEAATLRDKLFSTDLPSPVINCTNGELWLNRDGTHKLKPHSYRSYLTSCLNVEYNPGAECPLFMETLKGIFENFPDTEDMVRHMGEILGYTIQPYKNIASWWLFRGPGGDGKSTILKVLEAILEDAQLNSTIKVLSSGSTDSNNHAMASLVNKLAVIVEEVPVGYLIKDAGVKMLSENTKMEANPKHSDAFNFMYAGNLIMCSNGFPSTRDLSHGMFRRANVIPFNRQFTRSKEEDINRASDIIRNPKEMSGVLNFMLQGLERLRNRGGFKPPESCREAKEEWLGEANNVIRFTKELIHKTNPKDIVCELGTLYDIHYQLWCQQNDIDEKMRKRKIQFKRSLIDLGFVVRAGGKNVMKVYGGKLIEQDNIEDFEDEI